VSGLAKAAVVAAVVAIFLAIIAFGYAYLRRRR
jgi:hypothetical protein